MWQATVDWDSEAPSHIQEEWQRWTSELPDLSTNPINRKLSPKALPHISKQLHGFADASQKAYGGAVYLRITYQDTTTSVTLVMAKARVTPLKTLSIPRLEQAADLLTTKLLQ